MTDSVAASLAASTIEDGAATIEDGAATVVPGDDDGAAAAAKKAAANKKKRERQKAKKKADGEERDGTSFLRDVVPDLGATVLKEERRDAGPNRGQGMFATAAAEQKAVLAEAVPALTVVFDGATSEVCGFCFGPVDPSPPTRPVELTLRAAAGGGFGVMIDESPLPKNVDEGAASRACVTAVLEDSANYAAGGGGEESLKLGDRLVSVEGTPVVGGRDAAAKMLQEAVVAARGGDASAPAVGVRVVVLRADSGACSGCKKLAVCAACTAMGRRLWHQRECIAFCKLPANAKRGADTSILRMLLRWRATKEGGEFGSPKEPVGLLRSLQQNSTPVPAEQLAALSNVTGVSADVAASIIYMIRANACEVHRGGKRAGCALSALMGWHNHDCKPCATAAVSADGVLRVEALREIAEGEEVTISYVDTSKPFEERRVLLREHYGFDCRCARCVHEQRRDLKARIRNR